VRPTRLRLSACLALSLRALIDPCYSTATLATTHSLLGGLISCFLLYPPRLCAICATNLASLILTSHYSPPVICSLGLIFVYHCRRRVRLLFFPPSARLAHVYPFLCIKRHYSLLYNFFWACVRHWMPVFLLVLVNDRRCSSISPCPSSSSHCLLRIPSGLTLPLP